jgi:Kef-type K+ transport system membrane component KefB/mannitol/fructose-specific phosphotransferase system IIA component (Ntr-type)
MNNWLPFTTPFDDPVLIFALVMLIILLAPILFKKIRIPGIVGLILAGTLVGPGMLGLIERDFTIELLGTVGLLYLMFMAGLSIDLNRFEKLKEKSMGFGFISYLLPQLGAVYIGMELLDYSLATSLLLGAIVGSHTLLAYPLVERLGITKNTGVTMSMGGTLVTDTFSLGVLAIVAGSVGDDLGTGYWVGFGTSVVIFVAAALIILPRLGRWFFRNVQYENNIDFVFMVAILFATAFFAELAGLAPIIGAFMAGLLLNRLVPESGTLMSRIQFVGNALFIPFFLISVGMLVDVKVLGSLDVWFKALVFSALVFAGKGLAALIVKYLFKYTREESLVVWGLTTPQSAATLAVTLVGYELGFFDTTAVNAVVIMILITCLVGPWLVEKYGRIVAMQEDEKPYNPADAPQRILVPLANPETSDALMDIAFMVRDEKSGQPLYPLTVARDGANVETNVVRGEKMLSHAVIHAAAAEVPVSPVTRVDLNVAKGISRAVEEKLITNIVVGWNGEVSAKRKIFGSILDQLLGMVDEMIMVCKIEKPVNTFNRLVVAIPPFAALEVGFPGSIRSIKLMAEQMGADLVVVSTSEREQYVKKGVERIKPDLEITYESIGQWGELPAWLENNREENDLFVLISSREGTLSWRPGLDRLPRVISQRYPKLSFITVYSSEVEEEAGQGMGYQREFDILTEDRIKLNLKSDDIEGVLGEIISGDEAFKNIETERITRRLLENSADYTPEVMPGVVLYESHTSKVDRQVLFIGVKPEGIKIRQTANKAKVFLVLLSPKNMSAKDHLRGLNMIVKYIRPGKDVAKITSATTTQQVVNAVMAQN